MKKILTAAFLAFAIAAGAQVNFVKTTDLNNLLKQAREEKKLVFVDAYTDWCGWCKELDKHVFSTQFIGDTMNRYFIATKLEMEQDSIGIMLTRKYATAAYPTALILNGNGALVSVIEGYSPADEYAQRLADAANPSKHIKEKGFSTSFNVKYPQFYLDAVPMKGVKKKMPDSLTVNKYLERQKDLTLEYNWVVLKRFYFRFSDALYQRVLNNEPLFRKTFGDAEFEDLARKMISMKISACTKNKDYPCLERHLATLEKTISNGKKERTLYIENYCLKNEQWEQLAAQVRGELANKEYASNHAHLNDQAWAIYEKSDNKIALESAAEWMKTVVQQEPVYMYLDTYAALLYKTNRFAEAREYAILAIETGKQSGEDVSGTEELLKKIVK